MTDAEKERLIQEWQPDYLENQANDERTMKMLIGLLEAPKEKPDWKTACNLMKMAAAAQTVPEMFIADAFENSICCLLINVISYLTDQELSETEIALESRD